MPKRDSLQISTSHEHEHDDLPAPKKTKTKSKTNGHSHSHTESDAKRVKGSDSDRHQKQPKFKSAASSSSAAGTSSHKKKAAQSSRMEDENGDSYWELSSSRRVTVSEFKGKWLVNIREYYESNGKKLPGKKGISLPLEQFSTLIEILPELEQFLDTKGQMVGRPVYEGATLDEAKSEKAGVDIDEGQEANSRFDSSKKRNIDVTSDEEEDEDY